MLTRRKTQMVIQVMQIYILKYSPRKYTTMLAYCLVFLEWISLLSDEEYLVNVQF